MKLGEGFFGAAEGDEGLRGHLVGGDVVGIVLDAGGELGEAGGGIALGDVFHGEAVAGEGVGGIELEDFVERGDLVHVWIVVGPWTNGLILICTDGTDPKTSKNKAKSKVLLALVGVDRC